MRNMTKQKQGKKLKKGKVVQILCWCALGIILLELIVLTIFFILSSTGKRSLYQAEAKEAPRLPQTREAERLNETDKNWQEGWIRYQGKIYAYNEDMLTFLIMGIDQQGKVKKTTDYTAGGQADALFLVACNPTDGTIRVIAINRNTMAPIDVYDKNDTYLTTTEGQLTLQHAYGDGAQISCERTRDTVSKLFYDLPIHGYCSVNMGAIPILNDEIGGVEVTVLEDLTESDKSLVEGDTVLLQGESAYWYLRDRHMDEYNSAGKRLERQKQYIGAFMKKLAGTVKQSPGKALDIYEEAKPYLVTDIRVNEISYFATLLSSFDFAGYEMLSLKGETTMGDRFEEYHIDDQALYELVLQVFYKEVKNPQFGY